MRSTTSLSTTQGRLGWIRRSGWIMAVCAAVAITACRKAEPEPAPPPAAAPEPTVQQAPAEAMQSLADLATEYEALQQQADQTNKRIVASLARYQKRGGKLPPNFGPDLTDDQRQMLAERIQQERAGTKTLLQDIIDRDKQIQDLRARMNDVGARLPDHVTAKEGDTHDKIAMNYLIKKGVSAEKAFNMISELNLVSSLAPGFTVWTFYANGQFGTWISRGTAPISPQEHERRLAKLLDDERDEAKRTVSDLQGQVAALTESQEQLKGQARSASEEAGALMEMLAKEKAEKAERAAAANTIRYSLGSKSQLQKMKVIDGRLKLRSLDQADTLALNAADQQTIAVDATAYGLKKIKKITLVPEVFAPGTDYQLQQDGPFASIRLLNLEKFKRNQFVIVVE